MSTNIIILSTNRFLSLTNKQQLGLSYTIRLEYHQLVSSLFIKFNINNLLKQLQDNAIIPSNDKIYKLDDFKKFTEQLLGNSIEYRCLRYGLSEENLIGFIGVCFDKRKEMIPCPSIAEEYHSIDCTENIRFIRRMSAVKNNMNVKRGHTTLLAKEDRDNSANEAKEEENQWTIEKEPNKDLMQYKVRDVIVKDSEESGGTSSEQCKKGESCPSTSGYVSTEKEPEVEVESHDSD